MTTNKPLSVDTTMIVRLLATIRATADALDVQPKMIPSMLDTAYDHMPRDFAEPCTALLYRFMRDVFTLFAFTESDYDELQALITDDEGHLLD